MARAVDSRSGIVASLAAMGWLRGSRVACIAAGLAACDPLTGDTIDFTPGRTGVFAPGGMADWLGFACPEKRDRVCEQPAIPLARGTRFLLVTGSAFNHREHARPVARMEFLPEGIIRAEGDRLVAARRGRATVIAWDEPAAVIAVTMFEIEDPTGIAIQGEGRLVEGYRSRSFLCSVAGLAGGPGCTWTIDDPSVARLEPDPSRGWIVDAYPLRAGKTVLRAALGDLEATLDLTVLTPEGGDP
jgi:hypothetical protein